MIAIRVRPHSRQLVDAFWKHALSLPATIEVFHVAGADDFLLHVGVSDTDGLRDLVLDELAARAEVAHVETHLIYGQQRKTVLEPLD